MRFIPFLFFFIISSVMIFPQARFISGYVADSTSKQPLSGANVILIQLPDSAIRGAATDTQGNFHIPQVTNGKYILKVSYMGYKTYQTDLQVQNRSIELDRIYLSLDKVQTEEVEIIGKIPPVVEKVDTTEFNAEAFKVHKDASAEDLISKMPGITVQDGKVQARGEDVRRVLVDGRQFFGDDPSAVLRNIPAEIIDKIQVFDQQSEQAQFTGFDDGSSIRALNIVTRMNIRQGTFGKFTAGYGNEEKYKAGGNLNIFNEDQRITILGQLNNINEQNFSDEDLLGVMASSFGGRGGGMRGGFRGRPGGGDRGGGGFYPGGFGGGGVSDFLINARNGLSKTQAFGLNYSDKWGESIDLSGSYFFNQTRNEAQSSIDRKYFLDDPADQNYLESSLSSSKNINHRFNMRLNYQIDSSNSIIFRPRISLQQNDGSSFTRGLTTAGVDDLNSINNLFGSNLSALNSSAELLYRYRFAATGRTLSIGFTGSYNRNEGDSKLFSENLYYTNYAFSDTLDQISDLIKDGKGASANIVYTEPLTENGLLQFNSRISYSDDKSDQETFGYESLSKSYSDLDTSLSNLYKKKYTTQSFGTGYRYQYEGLFGMVNLNYNLSQLSNEQTFPFTASIEKKFYSLLPSLMIRYNISRDQNFRLFYRTYNNDPSMDQLQNVLNNSNPVQLRIGNPNLEQDYRHSFNLRYSRMDMQSLHSFFILLGGTFTQDYIGNNTIIASKDTTVFDGIFLYRGTQITRPENIDGYFNLRSFITYGLPVAFVKSNLNLNLGVNFSRTPGIINKVKNYANSTNYNLGFVLSSNVGENLDFTLSSSSSYSLIRNSVNKSNDNSYFNQNTRLKFFLLFWEGLVFQNELDHQYDTGLQQEYNRNALLWNISFGKKLFSKDQGEIRFTAYDVLSQNTNISRNVTDVYYQDTSSNVIGRYFLVSFIYNLRAF